MKSVQEFESYYTRELHKDLEVLEKRRLQIINRMMLLILIFGAAVAVSVVTATHYLGSAHDYYFFFLIILPVVLLLAWLISWNSWARDKHFTRDFKELVIRRIVSFISPELQYEPYNFVGVDSFERSRIFLRNVDRYKGDDLVHGMIDKTQFWFSEIKAEYKTTSVDHRGRTRTQWHTLFRGLFFIADFNKHFQGSTVVLPNRFGKSALSGMLQRLNLTRREKPVRLEDPDFNRHFVVYGEDQVESRYILSTSLMQRITAFRQKHRNPLFFSFVSSFVYVAIGYSKKLFEPNFFRKLTHFDTVREYFEDIQLATGIVEELNLNTRIWSKR